MKLYLVEEWSPKLRRRTKWKPANKVFWTFREAKAFKAEQETWASPGEKYRITKWRKLERAKRTVKRRKPGRASTKGSARKQSKRSLVS